MANEVIKIIATKNGSTVTATINDVNPEATNTQLATLGTKFNALTSNTYQETNRITTVNCDTEPGGGGTEKETPTLSATLPQTFSEGYFEYQTNSDGNVYVRQEERTTDLAAFSTSSLDKRIYYNKNDAGFPIEFYLGVTETDTYKGVEVKYTVN